MTHRLTTAILAAMMLILASTPLGGEDQLQDSSSPAISVAMTTAGVPLADAQLATVMGGEGVTPAQMACLAAGGFVSILTGGNFFWGAITTLTCNELTNPEELG